MSLADRSLMGRVLLRERRAWIRFAISGLLVVIAVAVAILPIPMVIWSIVAVAGVWGVIVEPLVIVAVLPFAAGFGALVSLDLHGFHAGPIDLLVACLVIATAWEHRARILQWWKSAGDVRHALRSGVEQVGRLWKVSPAVVLLFAGLLGYLATIVLSVAIAPDKTLALKETIKWAEVTVVAALMFIVVRRQQAIRVAGWGLLVAGLAEAVLGYIQWVLAVGQLGPGGASIRVFGTFSQPNPYAGYLNFAALIAVALAFFGKDIRERLMAGAIGLIVLGAEVLADSRGALLAFSVAVAIQVIIVFRRERAVLIAAIIGVPVLVVAWVTRIIPVSIQAALLRRVRIDNLSISGPVTSANYSTMERLAHWIAGIRMFLAHPILGVGAGNYNSAYGAYVLDPATWPEPLGHAHNYYINAAAETGILGLLTFLVFLSAVMYCGWRAIRNRAGVSRSNHSTGAGTLVEMAWLVGMLAVLVAVSVHNLTDDLFVHGIEIQVAMCTGILAAASVKKPATQ